jgi:regulator of sirC expression with transglutaminase-like and TPR domain
MDPLLAQIELSRLLGGSGAQRQPDLGRACLFISAVFDPSVDVDACEALLDAFAERAAGESDGATDSYAVAAAICRTLFVREGFRGNVDAFDEPANSLLSRVIERRIGIPITLSIVLMETARRLGLPLVGVGLPGHFIVRFPDATSALFIDAFGGGRILDRNDCIRLVDEQSKGRISWSDAFLEPVPPRAILKRVLVNLKNSLTLMQNYAAALAAIELQLTLDPEDPTELRDRGILFARLHRYDRAIADLEAYIERSPDAADVKQIRGNLLRYLREARNL